MNPLITLDIFSQLARLSLALTVGAWVVYFSRVLPGQQKRVRHLLLRIQPVNLSQDGMSMPGPVL